MKVCNTQGKTENITASFRRALEAIDSKKTHASLPFELNHLVLGFQGNFSECDEILRKSNLVDFCGSLLKEEITDFIW